MLDGARNAGSDVKLRCHDLAGLTDLPVVRCITRIDGCARCADGCTELVGNRQDHFAELFRGAECATARDDDLRRGQFRTIGRGERVGHKDRNAGVLGSADGFHRCRTAFSGCRKRGGAHGNDLLGVACLHRLDGVAGIDRTFESIRADDLDDFRDLGHIEKGCDARGDILGRSGRRCDDDVIGRAQRDDQRRQRLGERVGIGCVVGKQYLGNAGQFRRRVGGTLRTGAGNEHVDVAANLRCRRQRLRRQVGKGCVVVFCQKKNGHVVISLFRNLRGRRRL